MQQFYSYPGQPDRVEVVRLTAAGRGQRDVCGHGAAVTKWKNPKSLFRLWLNFELTKYLVSQFNT